MGFHRRLLPVVTITGSSLVVGCGSGSSCGSAGSACPPPSLVGPGYYEGTLTPQGGAQSPVVAIIADNSDGAMTAQDGTYYRFNVGFTATAISGTYYSLAPGTGGTQKASGSISAQGTSASLSGTLTLGSGTAAAAFDLTSEAVYKQPSALATLMGTWSYTANGFSLTVTIATDGTFTGTDSNNCSYAGSFGIINPVLNAYSESYTRTCNSVNLTFTGLAAYLPPSGSTGADIKVLADDDASEFLAADLQ